MNALGFTLFTPNLTVYPSLLPEHPLCCPYLCTILQPDQTFMCDITAGIVDPESDQFRVTSDKANVVVVALGREPLSASPDKVATGITDPSLSPSPS